MRQVQIPFKMPACALAASLLVAACGGGSSSAPPAASPTLTAQTISFTSPGNQTLGTAVPALSATATSGLAVSYASNSASVCTVSGSAVTLVAAGTCSITASQAGNTTYSAATSVTDTFSVAAAAQSQTITFTPPGNQTLGTAPAALSATASSGLAVTIASTTPSVCTVTGTTLTLVSAGQCSLTASQAGNASFAAATPVTDGFTVAAAPAMVSTLTFSSGFAAANLTVEGGAFGGYSGSNQDGYNCTNAGTDQCGSGGSFTPTVTAANSGLYYYYQTLTPATAEFVGIFVQAPGLTTGISQTGDTPGLQLGNQTTMKFNFGENPEWFASATHNFGVELTLGKHYTTSGYCNIKLLAVVTPTSAAAANYSIPLSSFAVTQNCAISGLTVAQALALSPISQVDFQGDGGGAVLPTVNGLTTGANLSVANTAPTPVYPTTLVVNGPITFQ